MIRNNKKFLLLVIPLLILLLLPSSLAVMIAVNKANLNFNDVLREGYAQETFLVTSDGEFVVTGTLEVEGPIADWITFIPENVLEEGFSFNTNSPQQITVIVQPPADAANDQYQGTIRVLTGELSRNEGGLMGSTSRAAFLLRANVEVTGTERLQCTLAGLRTTSTELGQNFDVAYTIRNTGNVRVQPTINLRVFDQEQENIVFEESFSPQAHTLPTTNQAFINQISNDLGVGQYWVVINSNDCGGGGLYTFDVLDRGGILDQGELLALESPPRNNVGDIILITGVFRNNGERTVSAKLRGTITQGEHIIKIIDTDNYLTPPGETARIETFFNPDRPGQYEVRARVLYNDKLTYERTTIINVYGEALTSTNNLWVVAMLGAIGFLLFLIAKKKKRRQNH